MPDYTSLHSKTPAQVPSSIQETINLFLQDRLAVPSFLYRFQQYQWFAKLIATLTAPIWLIPYGVIQLKSKKYSSSTPQDKQQARLLLYYLSHIEASEQSKKIDINQVNTAKKQTLRLLHSELTRPLKDSELRVGLYLTETERRRIKQKLEKIELHKSLQFLVGQENEQDPYQITTYALMKYKSNQAFIWFLAGKTLAFICALAAAISTFGYASYLFPGVAVGVGIAGIVAIVSAYITYRMYNTEMPDVLGKLFLFGVKDYLKKTEGNKLQKQTYNTFQNTTLFICIIPILIASIFASVMTYQGLLHSLVFLGPALPYVAIFLAGVTFVGTMILCYNSYRKLIEQGLDFLNKEQEKFLDKIKEKLENDKIPTAANIIFKTTTLFFFAIVIAGNLVSEILSAFKLESTISWIPKGLALYGMTAINITAQLAFVAKSAAQAASALGAEICLLINKIGLLHIEKPWINYTIVPVCAVVVSLGVILFTIAKGLIWYPFEALLLVISKLHSEKGETRRQSMIDKIITCSCTAWHNLIKAISRVGQMVEKRGESSAVTVYDVVVGGILTLVKSNISFARVIYQSEGSQSFAKNDTSLFRGALEAPTGALEAPTSETTEADTSTNTQQTSI